MRRHFIFKYRLDPLAQPLTYGDEYLKLAGITKNITQENILINLGAAVLEKGKLKFNNAGVLFFAKQPERFFLTSSVVCVNYRTDEKVDILDPVHTVKKVYEKVKDKGPVILLSHCRHKTDRAVAKTVLGLTAIIGGHDQII